MIHLFAFVGVTRLELATSRPPDAYSNQLSYTPIGLSLGLCRRVAFQKRCKGTEFSATVQIFFQKFYFARYRALSSIYRFKLDDNKIRLPHALKIFYTEYAK